MRCINLQGTLILFIICSYIRFPLYIFAHLQIYIIRTKLRSVRSSFFKVCSKAVFAGDCLGVPLRVGLSAASPRYAVGFPLQSLTWVKGLSLSCTCTLAHGLFRPGVRFRPLRQAAWPKPDIGAEGQTEHIRPCRHTGLRLFAETFRALSRPKEFPGVCPAADLIQGNIL